MKVEIRQAAELFPYFVKNPSLAIAIVALSVPIVLLFGAAKFSSASVEALVFFGILGVSALAYSAWIVFFVSREHNKSK
ncbi:hypothetical protein GCAAIG_12765 [Candidatus Electronema halotolerans]